MDSAERPNLLFDTLEDDPETTCPRCAVVMQKVRLEAGEAELTVDRCDTCRGFWLDAGETGSLFVFLEERLPIRTVVWIVAAIAVGVALLLVLVR